MSNKRMSCEEILTPSGATLPIKVDFSIFCPYVGLYYVVMSALSLLLERGVCSVIFVQGLAVVCWVRTQFLQKSD
jgi:hypothetical protein